MRWLIALFGIVSYALGLGGLTFFMLFIGSWSFLPFHVDSGTPSPVPTALLINAGLIVLFGLQHTVTARPGFKTTLTRAVPAAAERSTYVLLSGILMCVICFYWQSLPGTLWNIEHPTLRAVLTGVQLFGWALAVAATFLINHFELFGLQQVYFNLINKSPPAPSYSERFLYKIVRHPLQLGLLIGMWSAPTMTMTHLTLSAMMTIYVFIGLSYEERDLVASLGQDYEDYRQRVRMLLPIPRRKRG